MSEKTPRAAEFELEVPFHDVDPSGFAWHGHYAKYLELARCELLKRCNYTYDDMRESGYVWPMVDLKLRYIRPLRFGDRVRVRARLVEWEYRLRIDYLIVDAITGARLTKATTVQVAVDMRTGEMCLPSPRILFERLGETP